MKYFIAYATSKRGYTSEHYIKSKSIDHLMNSLARYADGCLATSQLSLVTANLASVYVREIQLAHFPLIEKKEFAAVCEKRSYSSKDL